MKVLQMAFEEVLGDAVLKETGFNTAKEQKMLKNLK